MSFSDDLYHDFARTSGLSFQIVPANHPADCDYKPEGVFCYCHLEVGKNGDVIVVRFGKHRVAGTYLGEAITRLDS